jgi:hypothetical protein
MIDRKILGCISIALAFIIAGCVSAPSEKKTTQTAPDWFLSQPKDDATFRYYVGSGTSKSGDMAEAEKIAIGDVIDKIFMYIGVEVTSDTTAEAKSSKDKFESDIIQVVKTSGRTKLSGFELVEKLPIEKGTETTIYILARYNKKELEARKAEIDRIFKERDEAISGPEKEGLDLSNKGKFYSSAIKFIEAAVASSTSKVANAEIKFKRNIDQAMQSVEMITFKTMNNDLATLAGQKFPEPFTLKVADGADDDAPGVPDVSVNISYMSPTKTQKFMKTKTNSDGIVEFDHPAPEFVGKASVTMQLDLGSYMEKLGKVPREYEAMVEALDDLIATKLIRFGYEVSSNAKNISMGIVILDIDQDGAALSKTETAQALVAELSAEKFKTKSLSMRPADLLDKGDFDVIELLASRYASTSERAIFGTARILSFTPNQKKIIAKCTATVQVVDLKTKEILLTIVKDANGLGDDEAQAQATAFKNIGKTIGAEIKNKLR